MTSHKETCQCSSLYVAGNRTLVNGENLQTRTCCIARLFETTTHNHCKNELLSDTTVCESRLLSCRHQIHHAVGRFRHGICGGSNSVSFWNEKGKKDNQLSGPVETRMTTSLRQKINNGNDIHIVSGAPSVWPAMWTCLVGLRQFCFDRLESVFRVCPRWDCRPSART